ncbi:MFS transporter [Protaetiibacter mangrovi]|uniref:Lysosomal dipeptide transporter MFSD1 n=1 Tax=Protaetiibacter mangrovi TaxID=2970926 RepID=A0ABT1ZBP9_9MICO|nr:MFS transporter [Protaetiibacter mangrovi]MCS0498127.1 MFS transporter [Protaetiibacter mangrovi]TPX05914.1 MFS transporter [Schumannella luteola]
MNSLRAWLVFGGAAFAYLVGVLQRTSFGVAGVDATDRFAVNAAVISTVAVVQIVVYAMLQIPVGVLADRIGAPVLIVAGAVVMAVGQGLLAVSGGIGVAVVARVLVGIGDAATFVSVIRLLPSWFSGRILPQLSQWVGMTGQLGQIVSAFPFALLLHLQGWTPAFLAAAAASALAAVVALAVVRRGTPAVTTSELRVVDPAERGLRASVTRPGTQLGFWAHLLAGTVPTMLGILWGYPFLTAGLGYDPATASGVFTLMVVGTLVSGPIVGLLIARHPLRRSDLVLAITWGMFAIWAVVLLWQPAPPLWLVSIFFLSVGVCGPASLIGLDVARSSNPRHAHGSATGIANSGGFVGGFVTMLLVGVVLDLSDGWRVAAGSSSSALYSLEGFRVAFLVPYLVAVVGTVGLLWKRRHTRRRLYEEEGILVAPLWVALFRARGRKRPPRVRE